MIFLGLVLIKDEVRKEAIEGIKLVKEAGIQTVMITGDNKETAVAIATELGIMKKGTVAITGAELDQMSDEEFEKKIEEIDLEPLLTSLIADYVDEELDELDIEDEVLTAIQDQFD